MNPAGPVHFVYLGGSFEWQHWRAVETARKRNSAALPIIWTVDGNLDHGFYPHHVDLRSLVVPAWLRDHPIGLANVKDLFAYQVLYEHGGLYLDLDTISLRPAWDLLGDADVCVSTEFPPGQEAGAPHNTAAIIARKGAPVLRDLGDEARRILDTGERTWGAVGPTLISDFAASHPGEVVGAPYRALNGWSYHSIGDYYANPRDPGDDVRVIHLYSSDHLDEFLADTWMPA